MVSKYHSPAQAAKLGVSLFGLYMALAAGIASASDQPGAAGSSPADEPNGDIVVTAQRREESINRVPISIASYSREAMARDGVRRIDDISRLTPSLRFVNTSGVLSNNGSNISIRNIASDVGSATTAIYIDETPVQIRNIGYFGGSNPYPKIFDLQRVEVLRGPQGTLFGAGAEGGAVRFITPSPDSKALSVYTRGELAFTEHGAPSYEYGIAVGAAISDTLSVRGSSWYRRDGGYVDQIIPATGAVVHKDINKEYSYSGRLALTWNPTDNIKITPSIYYQRTDSASRGIYWEGYGNTENQDYQSGVNHLEPNLDRFTLYSLHSEFKFGKVDLISNTSYFVRSQDTSISYLTYFSRLRSGNPFGTYSAKDPDNSDDLLSTRQRNFTQEIRLQSFNNPLLDWAAGVYFTRSRQRAVQATQSGRTPGVLVGGIPQYLNIYSYYDQADALDQQIAGFASVDIKPVEGVKLTLAGRYTHNKFDFNNLRDGPVNGATQSIVNASQSENAFTPRIAASYQVDVNNMLYASASKGFRPGGAQPQVSPDFCRTDLATLGLTASPTTYGSDSLWSYEIGSKNKLFGGKLNIDVNGYHIKWKDIQQVLRLPGCGLSYVSNLGSASGNGAEISINVAPVRGISIGGNLGYSDLKMDGDIFGGNGLLLRRKGQRIGGPRWTGSVFGQVEKTFVSDLTGYARANFSFASRNILAAVPGAFGYDAGLPELPPTNFTTLRLGLRSQGLDFSVFADNLTNSRDVLSRSHDNVGSPLYYNVSYRPRTIGLTMAYAY